MTSDEATMVMRMLMSAHDGCGICASRLVKWFCSVFPEFEDLAERMFVEEYGWGLDWQEEDGPCGPGSAC
jgi:hypothetical protein